MIRTTRCAFVLVAIAATGWLGSVARAQEVQPVVPREPVPWEARPARPPLPADTPEDAKVKEKLRDTRVTFAFTEKPVKEALEFLGKQGGINIVPDRSKFEDPDQTVTLKLTNVRLVTALELLTEQIGLRWVVRDGLVFISDEEGVRKPPMNLTYDVRDLLRIPRGIHPTAMEAETEKELQGLIKFIQTAVDPARWGPGGGYWIAGRTDPGILSITAKPETHVKIYDLLQQLRRMRGGKAVTCTYLIRDLLLEPGEKWTPAKERDPNVRQAQQDLVDLVTDLVNPDSWGSRESGAYYWARANFGILVVHHDLKTQTAVEDVLKRIRGDTAHLKTSAYDITPLLLEPGKAWTPDSEKDPNVRRAQEDLIKLIRETVEPASWATDPGCTISMRQGMLIVTQTPLVLERVTQLLDNLNKQRLKERQKKGGT